MDLKGEEMINPQERGIGFGKQRKKSKTLVGQGRGEKILTTGA